MNPNHKAEILAALSWRYPSDDPLADKLAHVIAEIYHGASVDEWEEVADAFAAAFGLDEDAVVEKLGIPPREAGSLDAVERPKFETLVPDGWFAKYLEWMKDHESPAQYHFGSAAAVLAASLPRRPALGWEARRTYPNLYVLLVGPSGARKGSAIEKALKVVVAATGAFVLPNEGTPQGFAEALKRRYKETGTIGDGLIVAPEFNVLVSDMQTKQGLVQWLTDWYDSPDVWERGLRGEQAYFLRDVYLNVLGGSVMEWLKRMPRDAITGGFMPRFIVFDAADKRHWRARPKFNETLEEELRVAAGKIVNDLPDKIEFEGETGRYLDAWYEKDLRAQYEATKDEGLRRWISRKQVAAMKLAVVWQLVDGGPKKHVEVKWLEQARKVVDWGDATVGKVYGALGVTRSGEASEEVMHALEVAGGRASLRTIVRALIQSYTKKQIVEALATLQTGGLVRTVPSKIDSVMYVVAPRGGIARGNGKRPAKS